MLEGIRNPVGSGFSGRRRTCAAGCWKDSNEVARPATGRNQLMAERAFAQETTRQSFLAESAYLRVSSPLFSALAKECADDEDIIQMCSIARPGQPVGALF